jgi:quercetin dioxygenase-like cupin family protein
VSGAQPSVRVVPARELELQPPARPAEYMRFPFAIATAVRHETDVKIAEVGDEEEARRRFLATREGVNAGVIVVGPGGGEAWHSHLSYYDVVLYVRSGRGSVSWRDSDAEQRTEVSTGDFVYIAPGATHEWLNAGDDDLELVWFMHFHNYPPPAPTPSPAASASATT